MYIVVFLVLSMWWYEVLGYPYQFQLENAIEYHVITGVYLYLGTCKQPLLFVPWETWVILRGT